VVVVVVVVVVVAVADVIASNRFTSATTTDVHELLLSIVDR